MKKLISVFLVVVLILSFTACNTGATKDKGSGDSSVENSDDTKAPSTKDVFKAGAYTGSAKGMNGDVQVDVVFTATAIESVTVKDNSETVGIADAAIERIPAAIVANQSISVDSVAGATLTSTAIKDAVADCITQAGASPEDFMIRVDTKVENLELDTDVLVIGGGIAGIIAASDAVDAGVEVVLIEKTAALGGATKLSGGEVLAAGTDLQKAEDIKDSEKELAKFWISFGEGQVNEKLLTTIADGMPKNIRDMQDMGVNFTLGTPFSKPWESVKRTHITGFVGSGLTDPLEKAIRNKGVKIYTDSPATQLIVEDGVVLGAKGTTPSGGVLTINAKKTILATGGYDGNPELMKKYFPSAGKMVSKLGEVHNGDALIWTEELGSPIIIRDSGIALAINRYTLPSADQMDPYGIYLYVDNTGARFMDESEYWFVRSRKILDLPDNAYFTVVDSKTGTVDFEGAINDGVGFKADSLEELAKLTGMDAEKLTATIEAYNKAAADGVDTEFGKDIEKITPIDTAPYYAVLGGLNSISGSFGGPTVNDDCQVVNAENSPIENLYAAGELANGVLFYKEYPCSGTSISTAIGMGRIAGTHAATAIIATNENKAVA